MCGIAATGEIFNCGGTLFLMPFHFINVANPYFYFSAFSSRSVAMDIFVLSEMWGPSFSVAVMCINVKFSVQYAGHPFDA